MNAPKATKEQILESAAEVIYHKGFNHTGIQEILNKAGVPKGSFYFYFKNKEDLGIQLIDYYGNLFLPKFLVFLNDTSMPVLDRMRRMFASFLEQYEQNDFIGGCPIGNLCLEMGDLSEAFREKLGHALLALQKLFAQFLDQAKAAQELPEDFNCCETAGFILSSWEGALLQTKVMKSKAPMKTFEHIVFDKILNV